MTILDSILITANTLGITFGVFDGNWWLTGLHAAGLSLGLATARVTS